jgi:hypothetical protein
LNLKSASNLSFERFFLYDSPKWCMLFKTALLTGERGRINTNGQFAEYPLDMLWQRDGLN